MVPVEPCGWFLLVINCLLRNAVGLWFTLQSVDGDPELSVRIGSFQTLRTQCYASVWAQAITPGCALASFDCSNMGSDLQQHPITPPHPPAPLRFATHALNCSHTLRTQCYASVWAQAITPG